MLPTMRGAMSVTVVLVMRVHRSSAVSLDFETTRLVETVIFRGASRDVLIVVEDNAVTSGRVNASVVESTVDGLRVDTSRFIAAVAGTAPGVVTAVSEAAAQQLLADADGMSTVEVCVVHTCNQP
jgi:hypothetical protein